MRLVWQVSVAVAPEDYARWGRWAVSGLRVVPAGGHHNRTVSTTAGWMRVFSGALRNPKDIRETRCSASQSQRRPTPRSPSLRKPDGRQAAERSKDEKKVRIKTSRETSGPGTSAPVAVCDGKNKAIVPGEEKKGDRTPVYLRPRATEKETWRGAGGRHGQQSGRQRPEWRRSGQTWEQGNPVYRATRRVGLVMVWDQRRVQKKLSLKCAVIDVRAQIRGGSWEEHFESQLRRTARGDEGSGSVRWTGITHVPDGREDKLQRGGNVKKGEGR
ncbi:hypothetical protein BV898_19751 [Hypsibius exemplaris]|uniref:Uncharacterized protein n=1 Tax=Hypsibius exemplaris TaxID=2072580 RepID=A0A9X6NK83_HYPEX|nr:hypothetical protein BV898_19751 [Hypsibius exemplaris]